MEMDLITVGWKPDKRAAARYIAIGCTQQYSADQVGVTLRTVQNWCAEDEFDQVVTQLRDLAWARVEPGIMANVELALEVQRQMFRGEVSPDDKRYAAAQRLIDRILDRLLTIRTEDDPDSPAHNQAANLIQINTGIPAS